MTTRLGHFDPLGAPDQAGIAQCQTEIALDQRLFIAKPQQKQALLDMLDLPAADNPGLRDLFDRLAPWEAA